MHSIPSEEDVINPMLDDDDEEIYGATPLRTEEDVINPMLDDDDEDYDGDARGAGLKPWEARVRTPDQAADLARRKAAGEVSDGTKKHYINPIYRRSSLREKDLVLLRFLRTFNMMTAMQGAILFGELEGRKVTLPTVKAVHRRLLGLQEMGVVSSTRVMGARVLWMITAEGIDALDSLLEQFHPQRPFTPARLRYSDIAHTLSVNQVAAQVLSGLPYYGKTPELQNVTLDQLIGEPAILSGYASLTKRERAEAAKNKTQPHAWGDLRGRIVSGQFRAASVGADSWDSLRTVPAAYSLGQPRAAHPTIASKGDMGTENYLVPIREHHHPDLVVAPPIEGPDGNATAIEVELSLKKVREYRSILRTYDYEFVKGGNYKPTTSTNPIVYGRVIWFTNNNSVKAALTEADTFGLMKSERMLILPLLHEDAKTKVTNGWSL